MSSLFVVLKSLSLMVLLLGLLTQAAPAFERRQIGNLQCNINRVQIITALAQLDSAVQDLGTDVASNATAAAAVTAAQGGIAEAEGGVRTILLALFTGQQAPAAARGQVEEGLDTVSNALGNLTLSDATATAALNKSLTFLQAAGEAGNGVLANCN